MSTYSCNSALIYPNAVPPPHVFPLYWILGFADAHAQWAPAGGE